MGQHAKPLRATLTAMLTLVAMAGAAGAEGTTKLIGDFYRADCALDGCQRPPSSQGLGRPAVPESGDKAGTLRTLEHTADQGHLAALWKLARMYAAGDGVPKDDQRAFVYFSQIANTHRDEPPGTARARMVADAFVALGHYYLKGIPNSAVAPDAVRARDMFAYVASYFGDTGAQYQLGRLYLDGSPSDPHQAARWLQLAATKGDCRAEAVLGDMLFQGQHVPRQAARGLMWLALARDCAGPLDDWIKPLYENAFRRANDDERAAAEDLLKGSRPGADTIEAIPIQNSGQHTIEAIPIQNSGQHTTSQDISFSQLLNQVDQGRVRDVLIQGPEIHGTFTDGRTFQTYAPSDPTLIERLNKKGVSITARPQSDNVSWFASPLISWLPFIALIGVGIFLWRTLGGTMPAHSARAFPDAVPPEALQAKKRRPKDTKFSELAESVVRQLIAIEPDANGVFIRTPLLYPSGSTVVVGVALSKGRYFVSDWGVGYQEADTRGASLFYTRHARPIAKAAGAGFDNQAFFIMGARRDQLVGAVITIANCSQEAYALAEKTFEDNKARAA